MTIRPPGVRDDIDRDALSPDYVRAAYDYWRSQRRSAVLPPIGAIDPVKLPRACLPYIVVMDVETDPLRFRSRLNGTEIVRGFGIDQTGLYFDEIPNMEKQLARFQWCVRERRPYMAEDKLAFAPHDFRSYQTIALPFGDEAHGVQRILFVFSFMTPDTGDVS